MNPIFWAKSDTRCDNPDCAENLRGIQWFWREERRADPNRPETAYCVHLCKACLFNALADAWARDGIPDLEIQPLEIQPEAERGVARGRHERELVPLMVGDYQRIRAMAEAKEGKSAREPSERKLLRREKTKTAGRKERAA